MQLKPTPLKILNKWSIKLIRRWHWFIELVSQRVAKLSKATMLLPVVKKATLHGAASLVEVAAVGLSIHAG